MLFRALGVIAFAGMVLCVGIVIGSVSTFQVLQAKLPEVPPAGLVHLGEDVFITEAQLLHLLHHECQAAMEGRPPEVPDTYLAMAKRPIVELLAAQQVDGRKDLLNGWKTALKRVILSAQTDETYVKRRTGADVTLPPVNGEKLAQK